MAAHGKIFVSYRRDDAPGDARSIYERLGRSFGEENVFMDVDQLLAGQRFDRELDKALAECDVLIAVIGARWMDLLSEYAQHGKRDYVQDEIAAALQRDIIVIPVMMGRESNMPSLPLAKELPENIRDLLLYQKHNIAHESFGRDAAHLIAALQSLLRKRRGPGHWRAIAVSGLSGLVLAGVLLGYWTGTAPRTQSSRQREATIETMVPQEARAAAKRNAEEAEQQRLAAAVAEEERKAKAAAEAEAQRKSQEAEQQRLAAAVAEEERAAKAAAEAEARRKSQEAEQQRLAAAKAEEERKAKAAAEAEARRKSQEAEQQRLAAAKAEEERKAAQQRPPAAGFTIVNNVAVEGEDYRRIKDATVGSCSSACVEDAQCKMFAYWQPGVCYLFDKDFDTHPQATAQVGFVRASPRQAAQQRPPAPSFSIVNNVAVEGDDYRRIRDATVGSCSSACVEDTQCKMFAYWQPGVCYLFDKDFGTHPQATAQVGLVR
jgi:TIR domain/PAN domain